MADINAHVQDQCYKRLAEKVENLKPINHKFKPFQTLKREQDPSLKQFHKDKLMAFIIKPWSKV